MHAPGSSKSNSEKRSFRHPLHTAATLHRILPALLVVATLLHGSLVAGQPLLSLRPISDLVAVTAIENAGDASGRLFLGKIDGRIWILLDGETLPSPFLDLSGRVDSQGEGGLLGLAFHPSFDQNRRFFVSYTRTVEGTFELAISEFKVSLEDPNRADPGEREILTIPQPTPAHQAGDITFGPDGMLYIASGDGGLTGPENTFSQDLSSRLGKILRLDVTSEEVPFSIPPDNPFAGDPDKEPTIWASGLRNPYRMSFDPATGRLFLGDVGEAHREEVNLIVKGGNYGWSRAEGTLCHPRSNAPCDLSDTLFPIYEYEREPGSGAAVIGGQVYRGPQPTPLWGHYFFAEFVEGGIWTLEETQTGWIPRQVGYAFNPFTMGVDEDLRLYLSDRRGVFAVDFVWRDILPHLAAGMLAQGELVSEILVANPGEEAQDVSIVWISGDGQTIEFEVDGASIPGREFSLPGRSSATLQLRSPDGQPISGWAAVTSATPLGASVIYSLLDGSAQKIPVSRAWASASRSGSDFLLPFTKDSAAGTDLALAVGNPSLEKTISLHLVARDSQQVTVAQADVVLPPLHRSALFVSDLLSLPEAFQGTLQILSDDEFYPLAMLTLDQIFLAALPPEG